MKKQASKKRSNNTHAGETHPGSEPDRSKNPHDFGVPAAGGTGIEREYVSENTKQSDPGAALPAASETIDRTAGVGGKYSGPGSASGGDLDTDIVGVADGRGVSTSGNIHEPPGPDDTDGSSDAFASGPHAQGRAAPKQGKIRGSTTNAGEPETSGRGADAMNSPARGDDSAAGEISMGEALGEDND
jgi:hypothetical protein